MFVVQNNYFWPEEDKLKLKEAYGFGGLKAAAAAFPDKKRGTVATQASRMGLTNPRPRKPK